MLLKLIDSKVLIEKEKIDLQSKVFELLEERNELKLITESKNASITKLQKQIFEVSPFHSFILFIKKIIQKKFFHF